MLKVNIKKFFFDRILRKRYCICLADMCKCAKFKKKIYQKFAEMCKVFKKITKGKGRHLGLILAFLANNWTLGKQFT
jgi:hypothetical protein